MFNLAHIHEAIAQRVPERDCLIFRNRRLDWATVTDRSRRLADVLAAHGLGCRRERAELAGWESGQDHLALYLYNGNEYLEGMLGAYKARVAPLNVNYRYVEDELLYLFGDCRARAILYHACFAPMLASIRHRLPEVRLWLQVADESAQPLLPGALDYEQALAEARPRPPAGLSPDDLYILYTGGTTGMPKGVLWRQEDVFRSALYTRPVTRVEEVVERALTGDYVCLPAPPFMHGAAHWMAFSIWAAGGSVVVQSNPRRLDPQDIWSTVERERVTALNIVGDAFGRPLADELARNQYDLSSLRLLSSGGAILSAGLKAALLERLPGIQIRDTVGSSESGAQGIQQARDARRTSSGDFQLASGNLVLREDRSAPVEAGSGERGWLARAGRVPLGYLGDPEKTRATFPEIDGVRHAVPGDRALLLADGRLQLLGRESVTINTGGEKVFAEEVEQALKHHPDVYDTVVVGTRDERFGQCVTALVQLRAAAASREAELEATARAHLAGYKIPRRFVFVDVIVRSPSGKADYRWARETAEAALAGG